MIFIYYKNIYTKCHTNYYLIIRLVIFTYLQNLLHSYLVTNYLQKASHKRFKKVFKILIYHFHLLVKQLLTKGNLKLLKHN